MQKYFKFTYFNYLLTLKKKDPSEILEKPNYLNNILTLDIIRMLATLVKFNILNILEEK